jgi:hypothetical protein
MKISTWHWQKPQPQSWSSWTTTGGGHRDQSGNWRESSWTWKAQQQSDDKWSSQKDKKKRKRSDSSSDDSSTTSMARKVSKALKKMRKDKRKR